MPAVSGLYVYPIKSCAGIALNEARLLPSGLEYDRNWLVCTPSGQMLTQRSHGRLALIQVALGESELIVSARGMPELRTPLVAEALEQPERFDVTGSALSSANLYDSRASIRPCSAWWTRTGRETCRPSRILRTAFPCWSSARGRWPI
jgi:uncharacterized protein YcbX